MKRRKPAFEGDYLVVFVAAVIGAVRGFAPISDNSALTHLTTGLRILDTHHVPHGDPYSFTALGASWTLQSWLPDVVYGLIYRASGSFGLIALNAILTTVVATLVVMLARTGSALRTGIAAAVVLMLSITSWTSRPTMFSFLFFALVILIVEKRWSPWWLVPVGAVWINSHGSWALGLFWVALVCAGSWLDSRHARERLFHLLACIGALLAGVVSGALISPVGPRLLAFPFIPLGSRSASFARIIEWQSPDFHTGSATVDGPWELAAILVLVAILVFNRPPWRHLLPAVAFFGLALYSNRIMGDLAIVVAPVLALAAKGESRRIAPAAKWITVLATTMAALGPITATLVRPSGFDFARYPVAGFEWLDAHGLSTTNHRVVTTDIAASYAIFTNPKAPNVFFDDRYDMYPARISKDYSALSAPGPGVDQVLRRYSIDAVLWRANQPLAVLLSANPEWQEVWSGGDWVVYTPKTPQSATLAK